MLNAPKQKVYQAVLDEIHKYIQENRLEPGDKLPSERVLAERLHASRSSIREALRAMELLGLIETRHGEGTFLRTYESYKTVELLSSFILRGDRIERDLFDLRYLIEKEAVKLAIPHITNNDITHLKTIIQSDRLDDEKHIHFFHIIYTRANNDLLRKIGTLVEEFSRSVSGNYDKMFFYEEIIRILEEKEIGQVDALYNKHHFNPDERS